MWGWFSRGNRPFTIIVAISSVVSACVVAFQWRALNNQNDLLLDIAWLENRPWVQLEKPILEELVAEKPLKIKVTISNSGKSPAYIRKTLFHIDELASLGATGLEIAQENIPKATAEAVTANTIPPEFSSEFELDAKHTIAPSRLKQVEAGILFLTVISYVEYADGRGAIHRTVRIHTYDLETKRFAARGNHYHMD